MTGCEFKILFVCTGNICRSPTADAVLRQMVRQQGLEGRIFVDSAGTHGYHVGDAPDPRTMSVALGRGVDMSDLRARKVTFQDFHDFDWIIAMDAGHHEKLNAIKPMDGCRGEIIRFTAFAGEPEGDIPDPYYGGADGFVRVYDRIAEICDLILKAAQLK